jgi:DNA polymerase III delta prime subunit
MQTILFISDYENLLQDEVEKIKKKYTVSPFNYFEITPSPSIGIEEVRKLQQIITLKVYGGGNRLIFIKDIDKATVEAQNALLKIMEEPPPDSLILLSSAFLDKLLPTVVSRCRIIVKKEHQPPKEATRQKTEEIFKKILRSSPGERILLSQQLITTKIEALTLLDNFLHLLENYLLTDSQNLLSAKETASLITKIIAAKSYLEKNVNYKATVDILFLSFPMIKPA